MDITYKKNPLFKEGDKKYKLTDIVDSFFDQDDYRDCAFYQYSKSKKPSIYKPLAVWISCNCKRCSVWY